MEPIQQASTPPSVLLQTPCTSTLSGFRTSAFCTFGSACLLHLGLRLSVEQIDHNPIPESTSICAVISWPELM